MPLSCIYMEIGIRELKQQLSKYLDQVEAGAEIIVTDRGQPKARVIPITNEGALRRGIEEGWIRAASSTKLVGLGQRQRAAKRTADVLDEDRA